MSSPRLEQQGDDLRFGLFGFSDLKKYMAIFGIFENMIETVTSMLFPKIFRQKFPKNPEPRYHNAILRLIMPSRIFFMEIYTTAQLLTKAKSSSESVGVGLQFLLFQPNLTKTHNFKDLYQVPIFHYSTEFKVSFCKEKFKALFGG